IPQKLLDGLPARFTKAIDESVSLFLFLEQKQHSNYAPLFTPLLGIADETATGLLLKKLTPALPPSVEEQKLWFDPYLQNADSRTHAHYKNLAKNLKKTLVFRNGVSPLGLLRSCIDYA